VPDDQLSVARLDYRPTVKAIDFACRAANAVGLPIGHLDQDSILRAAKRGTGLTNFGGTEFMEPMARVIDAAKGVPMTPLAHVMMRQSFILAARNRLRAAAYLEKHPEVRDIEVKKPVFVLGFPRTGTTVLQNLLSLDDNRRALQFWELMAPAPASDDLERDSAARIANCKRTLQLAYVIAPEMAKVHYIDAHTCEECWPLFGNSFAVFNYDLQSGLTEYGGWLMEHYDMRHAYRDYKLFLQILLHQRGADHLVLKCPEHLWFIDELLETFPDACIVQTHRDPYPTIASYCSLISLQWRTVYGRIDPVRLGQHISSRFEIGIRRAMAARQRHDPARFYDMNFDRLVADSVQAVRDISTHFDLGFQDDMPSRINAWQRNKRADARGQHRYDGELYGLTRDDIHSRYADYIDSFAVSVKAA